VNLLRKQATPSFMRYLENNLDEVCISSITYSELMYGVEKSQKREQNYQALMIVLSAIPILEYGSYAAEEYGLIRKGLEDKSSIIGPMDLLIASHAKSENLILVASNMKEFNRIDNLKLEDWME
ncbi:MAG: type II toxin-antitoxin system VapC family toxin, partial [Bacilli bacterium]|nr:type II toxin-antitoxin system VapC family toxin [Bacilli bacterium]